MGQLWKTLEFKTAGFTGASWGTISIPFDTCDEERSPGNTVLQVTSHLICQLDQLIAFDLEPNNTATTATGTSFVSIERLQKLRQAGVL